MREQTQAYLDSFFAAHPALAATQASVNQAVAAVITCYQNKGKVLTGGCGGSMSDAEHITGELLKAFRRKRPVAADFRRRYEALFGAEEALDVLEDSLPAVCLTGNPAILTAAMNDLGGDYAFAQVAMGLAQPGDVLIAISTSGNARLLLPAVKVARAKGALVVLLTGGTGGKLAALADISILAPAAETYLVQEQHIQLYHLLCAAVEEEFYG
jgi:phosphoheptose isomerase